MTDQEKELLSLQADLKHYQRMFKDASEAILEQDISNYPIFVAHQTEVELGIPLLQAQAGGSPHWSYRASTLEEFAAKKIIDYERVDDFKKVFKNPKKFVCVFIFDVHQSQFVFYPMVEI